EVDDQRDALASSISDAMAIKRQGNSADVVNVIGPDDELSIKVLGHDGQVLEIETPARHLLENVVAKTGLPSWMLGFHWSTAERLAQRQGEIALQESHTRFELRKPQLKKPCNAALRARGISFKPGDYDLIQDLPNLQDLEAQARANLMDAQAEALRNGGDINPGQQGDREKDDDPKKQITVYRIANSDDDARLLENGHQLIHGKAHNHKAETYVEDEDALMRLERRAERGLKNGWDSLYERTLDVLGIDKPKTYKAPDPVFVFDAALMLQDLIDAQDQFVASVSGEDSETAQAMYDSWLRGTLNASNEDLLQGLDKVTEDTRNQVAQQLQARSMELVKDATVRAYRDDIVQALQQGAYDGANPRDVARELKKRFGAHEYDWERLARSEIADAQVAGKESQYQAHELSEYDWIRAGGACPICVGLAEGGPYPVGTGPKPMRDSHPNCRCTIKARAD
ncbi:MAG: minor capsid protein, partial [Pseudomonadota bacterium]|nr:minor capsid protein [Pseudomonadota bacterium]